MAKRDLARFLSAFPEPKVLAVPADADPADRTGERRRQPCILK